MYFFNVPFIAVSFFLAMSKNKNIDWNDLEKFKAVIEASHYSDLQAIYEQFWSDVLQQHKGMLIRAKDWDKVRQYHNCLLRSLYKSDSKQTKLWLGEDLSISDN